jgi:uncharacterized protein YjbI with pentapeptide repeats
MANQEHLDILKQGVEVWNQWRKEHPEVQPDLSGANLIGANLHRANFEASIHYPLQNFRFFHSPHPMPPYAVSTSLFKADLREADLSGANLRGADLTWVQTADISSPEVRWEYTETNLTKADLSGADLSRAELSGANLTQSRLVKTNLSEAGLSSCRIYGISAWDVQLDKAKQFDLIITDHGQPTITVDNLEVAQFIYLLVNNQKIRHVIDTITSKVVLILGRFTTERKKILDALRDELRNRDYLPVVFDFDIPKNRDITETVSLLARMSRFVIADLTEARSIPQELSTIIPDLPSVPVQPILLATEREYSMFEHFKRYPWVLQDYLYTSIESLLAALKTSVI